MSDDIKRMFDSLDLDPDDLAANAALARRHNECPWPEAEPIPFGEAVDPRAEVWCGRLRFKMRHAHPGWANCRARGWDHYSLDGIDTSGTPLIDWAPVTKDALGGLP